MARPKVDRDSFEAQFHNHHHYTELDTPDPEWWELPDHRTQHASGGKVKDPYTHAKRVVSTAGRYARGGESGKTDERSIVDRALALTSKRTHK